MKKLEIDMAFNKARLVSKLNLILLQCLISFDNNKLY